MRDVLEESVLFARRLASACALAAPFVVGCGPTSSWNPPAPAGTTYFYDHQGFAEKRTTVIAGGMGGPGGSIGYGGAFSFREGNDLHGPAVADPFAESAPIDGVRFNPHLGAQGIGLAPARPASSARP